MPRFAAGAALALAAVLCAARAGADSPADRIVPLVKTGDPVPQTLFVDQTGRRVSLAEFRGDAVAIAFIYLRCRDTCPLTTRKLAVVSQEIGPGPYRILEVTIDPEHDRPADVAAYAREYGAREPQWLILTGAPAAVDDFDARMGIDAVASGPDDIIHNDRVVLVSPDGTLADIVDGRSWTPGDLAAQLRHTGGRTSSLLDRFDLALGAAAAYCGGALSGRAGIGDLLASLAVLGGGAGLFVWLIRRTSSAGA
jgi:protein SCO1/2